MRASLTRNPTASILPTRPLGAVLRQNSSRGTPLCRSLTLKTAFPLRQSYGRLCAMFEEEEGETEEAPEPEPFGERRQRRERDDGEFDERVVELRRVATTVKGGRNISFRAVMVVGNYKGTVGVGNASAKEIAIACRKAALDANKNLITITLDRDSLSFAHIQEAKFGAARVLLRPACNGTGVIAGGAVRTVLEIAGVRNGFGKILNSGNAMNNAKATIKALSMMRTLKEAADERGVTVDYLTGKTIDLEESACPPSREEEMQTVTSA